MTPSGDLIRAGDDPHRVQIVHGGAPQPPLPDNSSVWASPTAASPVAETIRIIRRRYWVLVVCVIIATTLAAISALRKPKIYQSSASIAVMREAPLSLHLKDDGQSQDADYGDDDVMLDTQAQFLRSDAVALDVMTRLNLIKPQPGATAGALTAPRVDNRQETAMLDWFRSSLSITNLPGTRILVVRFSHHDPKMAAQIVNTIVNTYIERNIRAKYEATTQTSDFLAKQLSDLQAKMETSQEKLVEFEKDKGIIGIDEKQNIITSKLNALNGELTAAENDRIQKEAIYRMSQSENPEVLAKFAPDGTLDQLRTKELDLKMQLSQASVTYGPSHPKIVDLKARLADVQNAIHSQVERIAAKVQGDYMAARQREAMLGAALDQQKKEANDLNENAIQYNVLKHEADSYRQLYENLLQRLKEASITAGLRSTNLRVVDYARVPLVPSSPNIPRTIELGALLGLACGLGLIFVLEQLDSTVRSHEQIELIAGVPAIAVVPANSAIAERRFGRVALAASAGGSGGESIELASHSRPRSDVAEAYRALRTSLMLSSAAAPPRVIVTTSPLPQEGKTTTSINTAIVLAQKGLRVLLIDGDMRRPAIGRSFGLRSSVGLSSVLARQVPVAQAIAQIASVPGLHVLPAGPIPPYPSELLGSSAMAELLNHVRNNFDHVIIDTPPALSVTDAVLLAVLADTVVIVVRAGQTTKQALRRTREILGRVNTRIAGVVLNALDRNSADHYYYYGGKYASYSRYYEEEKK